MGTASVRSTLAGSGRTLTPLILALYLCLYLLPNLTLTEVKAANKPAGAASEITIDQSAKASLPAPAESTEGDDSQDALEQWAAALTKLKEDIQMGRSEPEAADQFYLELNEALGLKRQQLRQALGSTSPYPR
ncbi:MAG: hypothetical protein EX260_10710, partial [Desulfobulbaceae bacterium]